MTSLDQSFCQVQHLGEVVARISDLIYLCTKLLAVCQNALYIDILLLCKESWVRVTKKLTLPFNTILTPGGACIL